MKYLFKLISSLPISFLYLISSILSIILSNFYRIKTVENNLKKSFPNLSINSIKKIKSNFYKNFSDVLVETIKSNSISKNELSKRVKFVNFDIINNHVTNKERVIVLTSHQCNWEWLLLSSQNKLKSDLHVIYKNLSNKSFDKILYKSRSRFGSKLIESKKSIMFLKKKLKKVKVLAMVADQSPNINNRKIWYDMLNQKTAFYQSVNFIPKLTNSIVYFASMKREKRGFYSVKFDLISKPPYDKKTEILLDYVQKIESLIKKRPAEWLWSHKRWKLTQ